MNKLKQGVVLSLAFCTGFIPCCAQEKLRPEQKSQKTAATAIATQTTVGSNSSKEYVIGEADLLHITVYKEAELSQNAVVRPDGMISLPLVNEIKVSGKTPHEVQTELAQDLKSYILDPQVTVTVVEVRSKSVYVTGEVGVPGIYPLLMPTTVLQILARAGGPTPYANRNGIFVLRTVDGRQEKIPFPYKDVIKGKKSEMDIPLRTGDTVVVP